jgi:hypothetical protein
MLSPSTTPSTSGAGRRQCLTLIPPVQLQRARFVAGTTQVIPRAQFSLSRTVANLLLYERSRFNSSTPKTFCAPQPLHMSSQSS